MNDTSRDPVFPGGLVLDLITDDFDEMASVAPKWDQEYLKLGKGAFHGHLLGLHTNRIQVGIVSWEPGILSRGSTPPRSITLAMLLRKGGAASAQGTALEEDHVLIFEPGREFELSALGKSTILVVAIEEELFRDYAAACWDEPVAAHNSGDRLVVNRPLSKQALGQICDKLPSLVKRNLDSSTVSSLARSMEKEILEHLLSNVERTKTYPVGPSRRLAAKRAAEYLLAHTANAVSIAELCNAVKANERTLLLGFQEVFGVSPKLFQKSLRLNRANLDLRRACPGTTVTEVAVRWGFTHLGRFAADYRQMFGESPNQTLKIGLSKITA